MMQDPVHVHIHLPEGARGGAPDEARHEHVHVYLHLDGAHPEDVAEEAKRRPFLRTAGIVAALLIPIGGAIVLSHERGDASPERVVARIRDRPESGVPAGFAQQLASPPRVTMPPGVPAPEAAPTGPAAFGLNN